MIYAHENTGIAVLCDGQAYWLEDSEDSITLRPYISDPIAVLKMHSRSTIARTETGRFIFVHKGSTSNSDITADIETALSEGIDRVEDFSVDVLTVVAQTKRKVCIIDLDVLSQGTVLKNMGSIVFKIDSNIDLFCFKHGHGFARTSKGLYSVGNIASCSPSGNCYWFE